MPKITISEKDLTTPSIEEIGNNIAYVPGYAIMGPVNTPTLCTTLDEFQKIFGTVPYVFKTTQAYPSNFAETAKPTSAFILKDDAEKSYIEACELLRNGLPVLFERVMAENKIDSWTAKVEIPFLPKDDAGISSASLIISAKNPGAYGNRIGYTLTALSPASDSTHPGFDITLTLAKGNGIAESINEEFVINFDPTSENYYANIESSLVDFTITGTISNEKLNLTTSSGKLAVSAEMTTDEFLAQDLYDIMDAESNDLFSKLVDKTLYDLKFISSGAYPTFEYNSNSIVTKLLKAAANRGDAIALVDHTNKSDRALSPTDNSSVYAKLQALPEIVVGNVDTQEDARKYGAMFTPYAIYKPTTFGGNIVLPASFAYLNSLAVSVRTNENWYAIAGVTRGLIPNFVQPVQLISGALAESYQKEDAISINPIINVRQYGYCIWGNRTLNKDNGLVASSFLNIRALSNDVKKLVYKVAKELTFELNSDILWLTFRSKIEPTLDRMVSGNGLSAYKVIRKATTERATIKAIIRLYAIEAVENWDITIELADSYVSVE